MNQENNNEIQKINNEDETVNNTDLVQYVIEELNLESLIKLSTYQPYYDKYYFKPYNDLSKSLAYYLKPFFTLQKPLYPFTCFTEMKSVLKDAFELHSIHPTSDYTDKLNSVISKFTKLQIYFSDLEGENSTNSRKCNHIIALCKEIKIQRDRFCRHYKYNPKAYVID